MKLKSFFRDTLATPAVAALVLPLSFVALLHWSLSANHPSSRGAAYEVWETSNGSFNVRVTASHEAGGNPFQPGAYITYQAAPIGSDDWRELMQFHTNDTIRIARDSIRFARDGVGYVFAPSKYAVTLDGGRNWSDWEPVTRGPRGERLHWVIRDAQIKDDGMGEIHLYRYDVTLKEGIRLNLHTTDFGRSWSEAK